MNELDHYIIGQIETTNTMNNQCDVVLDELVIK